MCLSLESFAVFALNFYILVIQILVSQYCICGGLFHFNFHCIFNRIYNLLISDTTDALSIKEMVIQFIKLILVICETLIITKTKSFTVTTIRCFNLSFNLAKLKPHHFLTICEDIQSLYAISNSKAALIASW